MTDSPDNKYQEYLEKKHAGFQTDPALIVSIVDKATGSSVEQDERVVQGEMSEVHRIKTASGKTIIVRISRSNRPRFFAEKWAIEKAKETGVPTPESLLVEERENEGVHLTFSVQNEVSGIQLRDYLKEVGKESEGAKQAVIDSGRVLAKIHSVIPNGFGKLSPEGKGKYKSWRDFMLKWNGEKQYIRNVGKKVGIDTSVIDEALDILEENKELFDIKVPHLLHGDYGGDHIFVDKNGKVSGIIDLENCMGGDIAWDFSWWEFYGINRPPVEWLIKGYSQVSELGDNFKKRVALGVIKLGLDIMWYYDLENNESGKDYVRERLNKAVEDYNHNFGK